MEDDNNICIFYGLCAKYLLSKWSKNDKFIRKIFIHFLGNYILIYRRSESPFLNRKARYKVYLLNRYFSAKTIF